MPRIPTLRGTLRALREAALPASERARRREERSRRAHELALLELERAQAEALAASGLFDSAGYLDQYPDVAAARMDPRVHYLRHGWREGRQPSTAFDGEFYLGVHADVRAGEMNPLLHYVQYGRAEGRATRARSAPAPRPAAPAEEDWQALAADFARLPPTAPLLDVLVPVYRGHAETAHCLFTLARSRLASDTPFGILVIDDATPEPALRALLEHLASLGLLRLLRNDANLGFVQTVNRGLAEHAERDVIVLNADTEVHRDWVDRLRRAAYSARDIGTVTPFSNNATFCSYPVIGQGFAGAFEAGFEEIDALAARANAGLTRELPAARGFCMYLKRDCLREVGPLDLAFGRGHGEETDFSRRALRQGWRSVLAADVFVRHLGNVSFRDSAAELGRRALELLRERHPGYLEEEAAFVRTDPLGDVRHALTAARFRRAAPTPSVLLVVHHSQGGTARHVAELLERLAAQGIGAFLLRPWPGEERALELAHPAIAEDSGVIELSLESDLGYAASLLRSLGVFHIHVHHLMDFPPRSAEFIAALAAAAGVRYDFSAHDYFSFCPRVNMIDASGRYCGNLEVTVCQRCIDASGSRFGAVQVSAWREQHARLLRGARKVFVPDDDVRGRLERVFEGLRVDVRPHPETVPASLGAPLARRPGEPLRVAVIGAIGPHKGSAQILRYAEHAARAGLPLRFALFGCAPQLARSGLPTIDATHAERCSEEQLAERVAQADCHLALFAAVGPETYSYTLSLAFFHGLYPVSFDLGAIARRIRAAGWGLVLPFEWIDDVERVNAALLECKVPPRPPAWRPVPGTAAYADMLRDYYGLGA